MRNILIFFMALTCVSIAQADILVIGDSHTVGPFGTLLHKNLAEKHPEQMILVYGHSSSAPIHWMSQNPIKLSGGINHHMSLGETYLPHPALPDWRIKQNSLNLLKVLENPVQHEAWRKKISVEPKLDTIVIALGANDRSAVSTTSGNRTTEFKKRVELIGKLLDEVEGRGIKCIWIGPPSSPLRPDVMEQVAQEYLMEGIKGRCPFYDSRKFVAKFCDKVHFSCAKGLTIAKQWAQEAADFVSDNL